MKSAIQSYAGPLNPAQIAAGIEAAQGNAIRLIEDAKVLFDAKRLPSATALAILSMEERGKVTILKRLAGMDDPAGVKTVWKEYRSHRAKNAGWIIPDLVRDGARTMQAMALAVEKDEEHSVILDALKQVSFYTDCLGKQHWSIPTNVVDEALAKSMIAAAELMWGAKPVAVREIELWAEIVGPHHAKTTMVEAVLQWQSAMIAEGLSDTPIEALAAFMTGELVTVGDPA